MLSEQFDEATIKIILEAVVALLEIDAPESKAKVLMLIAEIAKSGNEGIFVVMFNELVKQICNQRAGDSNLTEWSTILGVFG